MNAYTVIPCYQQVAIVYAHSKREMAAIVRARWPYRKLEVHRDERLDRWYSGQSLVEYQEDMPDNAPTNWIECSYEE